MRASAPLVMLLLLASPAAAQRGGENTRVSRFQDPAQERQVEAPEEEASRSRRSEEIADNPENMEDALYLQERPDNLGDAAREFQNRMLQRLLAEREELVVQRRGEAIRLLVEFVREEPDEAPEMPDALLRLAELRWEEARIQYLRDFAAWQEMSEGNRGDPPRPNYDVAIRLYDRILTNHEDFPRYDLVLYMKAYALVELGNAEGALAIYRRILDEFPESGFRPDAHMALAEAQFSETYNYNYEAALEQYDLVLEYPDSGLYDVALFKSAWCLWRMNRTDEAANRFRMVLDFARQNRAGMSSQQRRRLRELEEEALEYLIQVFIEDESNTATDVFAFLEEIGGEQYANRVLMKLSETYYGQSRYERGIEAYDLLLERDPMNPQAWEWQAAVAEGYAAVDDEANTVEALEKLAQNYGPRTRWARNQSDPELIQRASREGERRIRRQALMWHEEGQRDEQIPKLEQAVALYGVYLDRYRNSRAAYQIRFFRGEILFHRLERYPEAGDEYLAAAKMNPRGELTRDSLYNAIGAFEHVREEEIQNCVPEGQDAPPPPPDEEEEAEEEEEEEEPRRRRRRRGDDEEEEQADGEEEAEEQEEERPSRRRRRTVCGESRNDRKFQEAITMYVELFPEDPDLPEILFRQGRLYYDRGIYDPAVRLFGQLIQNYGSSDFAEPAGDLILASFRRAQDYGNVERWARRLKDAPAFADERHQRELNELIVFAAFKKGEQLAERGEHEEAANAYFQAAEEFPQDRRAKEAYLNAGTERQRAGNLPGAAAAYDRLIERHPNTTEGADGCWRAAQMYESIAQFSDAARYYERYVERFPRGEKAQDAGFNSVLLRVTAGDNDAAVENGQRFLRANRQHARSDEVTFFIGRAHEANENWSEAANLYRGFTRRTRNLDLKVEATTRLAMVLFKAGNRREANSALEQSVSLGRRNAARLNEGLYYAAQARYMQGEQVVRRYEDIEIAGDVAGLRDRLERKATLLRESALIFTDVVEFQVAEWVTAALFQIGRSFEEFAKGLSEQPVPEGLSENEEASYREQLAMFIIPMEDQAIQAYEGGYQKALELRIFNRWTARLRQALSRMNDQQFPPLRELGGEIVEGVPLAPPEALDGLRRGGEDEAEDDDEEDEEEDEEDEEEDEEDEADDEEEEEDRPRRRGRRR